MTAAPPDRVPLAPLAPWVGRDDDLHRLCAALEDALANRGGLALIAGEGGIGKSRLCEELAVRARQRDVRVSWGRCWEAGGAPAYWPWTQVLRAMHTADPQDVWWRDHAPGLAAIFPEGADSEGPAQGQPPPVDLSVDQARFVLLDRLCAAICAASRARPRLLVLEDLHVADAASLAVLDLLGLQARSAPLLVVGTFRDAAIYPGHETLLRLFHQNLAVPLGRLEARDVRRYLSEIGGEALAKEADRVHTLCEGNPLVMVETGRLLRRTGPAILGRWGAALDGGLKYVLRERLAVISPRTRAVLEAMSVWGRDASRARIAGTYDGDPEHIEAALREALDAALLTALEDDRLRFSHILTREALYRELSAAARERLHARAATVLEQMSQPSPAEVGHHWRRAGREARVKALALTCIEGEAAMGLFAFDLASERYAEATALHRGLHPEDAQGLARLYLALGRADLHAGRRNEGQEHCQRAAEIYRHLGDAQGLAQAALEYGAIMHFAAVDRVLVALLEEAERALGDDDTPLRARVLARLAAAIQPSDQASHAVHLAQRAIAMARALHDERLLLEVLRIAAAAMIDVVDARVCRAINAEHAALAERLGETEHALRAHARLAFDAFYLGDRPAAQASMSAATHYARQLAHPLFAWYGPAFRALVALYEGRAADAQPALEELAAMDRCHPHANRSIALRCQRLRWARLMDDETSHREMLAGLIDHFSESPCARILGRSMVAAELMFDGSPEVAEFALSTAEIETLLAISDNTALPVLAEIAVRRRDVALAQRLATRLHALGHVHTSTGLMTMVWDSPADYVSGLVAQALGDFETAAARWASALELALREEAHPSAARVLLAWVQAAHDNPNAFDPEPLQAAMAALPFWRAEPAVIRRALTVGGPLTTRPQATSQAPGRDATFSLISAGEHWQLTCEGKVHTVRDTKGIRWLAALLAEPGREFHVLHLSAPEFDPRAQHGGLEILDDQAIAAYRQRLDTLDALLEDAREFQDLARIASHEEERTQLMAQLAAGLGLGGRSRQAPTAAERARVNVQRRIKDAIVRIAQLDPRVGAHLRRAIRTGVFCVYDPDDSRARIQS